MAIVSVPSPLEIFKANEQCDVHYAIPLLLDFNVVISYDIDLSILQNQGFFTGLQGLYIDNSANPQQLILVMGVTNQRIVIPKNACAYIPVLQPVPSKLNITSTAGAFTVGVQLLNFYVAPAVWTV